VKAFGEVHGADGDSFADRFTAADRAFRASTEKFGLAGNERSFMFTRAPVGIIGFGDLGRKLRALIAPFRNPVSVYDPWLPDARDLSRIEVRCQPGHPRHAPRIPFGARAPWSQAGSPSFLYDKFP
jgi:hypothetical protein